ncbi:MAG: 3-deoxy-manno-octulosonate cytidylyltransferase, partial [Gammaproteobacteria bacterium]
MDFSVIIPARYASSRLPGKPLRRINGKPLLQYVFECAQHCGAQQVVVATDDVRIRDVAEGFGAQVCMTSPTHRSGTDRLAEVVDQLNLRNEQIVVNLQGDEPLMPVSLIQQVATNLHLQVQASVATLCEPIRTAADLFSPNITKVVMDSVGHALYFSRAPIPWDRTAFSANPHDLPLNSSYHRHIGLYAYRVNFLREFVQWPVCALEKAESLEQLRVLWNGRKIHVGLAVATPGPGVDTEEDVARVELL